MTDWMTAVAAINNDNSKKAQEDYKHDTRKRKCDRNFQRRLRLMVQQTQEQLYS